MIGLGIYSIPKGGRAFSMEGLHMSISSLVFSRELSQHSNNSNIYRLAWTGVNTGAYLLGEWGKMEKEWRKIG